MNRGRPKLPEGEKLVHYTVRLPQWVLDACREQGNPAAVIREVLIAHLKS